MLSSHAKSKSNPISLVYIAYNMYKTAAIYSTA